jgi:hypothetical protein
MGEDRCFKIAYHHVITTISASPTIRALIAFVPSVSVSSGAQANVRVANADGIGA